MRQRALTELGGGERRARRNDLAPRLEVRFTPTERLKPASRQVRTGRAAVAIGGAVIVEQRAIEEGPITLVADRTVRQPSFFQQPVLGRGFLYRKV